MELEDCTFCYCPYYPCGDLEKGGVWIKDVSGNEIWDCTGCTWIHKISTVEKIYDVIDKGIDI